MDVADLLPMGHIPLEIVKEIIKKVGFSFKSIFSFSDGFR